MIWFNYKYRNIIKILVGIVFIGVILFLLKVFGGRVLDKVIIKKFGFLDFLEYGDLVLVDRGFLIFEDLVIRGVFFVILSFIKGKK